MNLISWFWIIFVVILGTAIALLIRRLTLNFSWLLIILIVLFAALSFYGYYRLFSGGNVGVSYAIITGLVIVLVALGALFFYKETWTIWTGIGLALIVAGILVLGFLSGA